MAEIGTGFKNAKEVVPHGDQDREKGSCKELRKKKPWLLHSAGGMGGRGENNPGKNNLNVMTQKSIPLRKIAE